ncbi:CDP-glucose 4,6-dehydratase [Crateriforma spongiae]|uniref:CDP-glucose 4,6-dehydratase n=1 Tax=Crateriforma spongiae TaxID=2724528 RepID=UPI001447B0D2|nr:CDP-glucose 4,6-dehydratase [Crateriforma spongiae]
MFNNAFRNRSVFLTGHTGFKGSWLCQWLLRLGANVHGFALDPQPHETLFDQLGLPSRIASDSRGDVRDASALRDALLAAKPDYVFHLAAQPLVRFSFEIPVDTFATNVMGTVHLLDALRQLSGPCRTVVVTTDKCYENREWLHAYRENDPMGGHDPYSASKGCAELVVSSYRNSYFAGDSLIDVASARAGNVIGGGDWASDRIIPDVFRAIFAKQPVPVRNRTATRPWQHVLEPLSGYLWLAANMDASQCQFCDAFNFGPSLTSNRTVLQVVQEVLASTGGEWLDASDPNAPHEASKLNLAIDKAFHLLSWQPTWDFKTTIQKTVQWYLGNHNGGNPADLTSSQIDEYEQDALQSGRNWASENSVG